MVHQDLAEEVRQIFEELLNARFPIERAELINHYGGDDERSCEANNSSGFCSRMITGQPGVLSDHAFGRAIDINPKWNPYQKNEVIIPKSGAPFLDRTLDHPGMIKVGNPCYRAFISRGWSWGGDWLTERGYVDYHHWYKH